ncbi:DmsC/YnfH family molybdoenzyme membrane anchor subunit [Rubripirellula reticaptiva]|uniref:Anaerobic dimethyl sulfoxide reductase chain B n=1 Tax=Rubripirellula reticaptiva TaxID=2528013 RepID=A0A5C6F7V6_9BACT|nr:DmsC/YnfH family molybdoenzyme membrane anchor subunit [Rubripirellula reticaptiva]TWU57468.1 Anaerobic dimethyl sulfoxide reductase chain B [Rubripirellula reticaptiva]
MSSSLPIIDPSTDLIGQLLAEQQSLSAVEQFSSFHAGLDKSDAANLVPEAPAQERYYRNLLPASPPGPDQQFAFEVDLDKCSGCKACVVACHTLNGLEEDEAWRRVGTLTIGETLIDDELSPTLPAIQHVTTACHHCEDPGCLNGCPVKAYEKDPVTGIVRHLDDQCIGCKYCTMMCPYEVPQYSDRLGIVRKCDMCHQRLSAGEAPACVQACPNEAIAITVVQRGLQFGDDTTLAPGAPLSSITQPTTQYKSSRNAAVESAMPQDASVDHVAESHWPLAVMLVATQAAVGMIIVERLVTLSWLVTGHDTSIDVTRWTALTALLVGGIGLNIAPLHLGKPLRAWRVFLGLRTSWLSREAIILGKFMGLLGLATGLLWMPVLADYVPSRITELIPSWAGSAALAGSIPLGIAGLFSSGMIYVATKRRLWRMSRTMTRFFGSSALIGICSVAMIIGPGSTSMALAAIAAILMAAKLAWEWKTHLGSQSKRSSTEDARSHRLVIRELKELASARILTAAVSIVLLLVGSTDMLSSTYVRFGIFALASISLLAGELVERLLYFSSVVYDRMPGTFR